MTSLRSLANAEMPHGTVHEYDSVGNTLGYETLKKRGELRPSSSKFNLDCLNPNQRVCWSCCWTWLRWKAPVHTAEDTMTALKAKFPLRLFVFIPISHKALSETDSLHRRITSNVETPALHWGGRGVL
eukprot:537872-Amphidinium_carterae.1